MPLSASAKEARRRRSSSLVYTEPPESLEHISDQAALPNLNADWVHAKGTAIQSQNPVSGSSFNHHVLTSLPISRGLGYPFRPHCTRQDPVRHHSRRVTGNVLDPDQHLVHVWIVPHVPLRARCAF